MFGSQAVLCADLESAASLLPTIVVLVANSSVKQWLETWRSTTHGGPKQRTQQSFKTFSHKDNLSQHSYTTYLKSAFQDTLL